MAMAMAAARHWWATVAAGAAVAAAVVAVAAVAVGGNGGDGGQWRQRWAAMAMAMAPRRRWRTDSGRDEHGTDCRLQISLLRVYLLGVQRG